MSDLTPITREEALLDGQDLEPITRKEQFIKRIYDKTQEVPTPITREEWFLNKAGEGGSEVTVEQLNATENGTYSEQGKAYSPVIVEVPEPTLKTKSITANGIYSASADNADGYSSVTVAVEGFKKKSIANTPTDIASFNDGTANPMSSLEISIEPVQSGSGDPSPENVRPISGWSGANVTRCGKNIWDEEWEVGDIDAQGNPTSSTTLIRTKNFNPCKPNTTYKVVTSSSAMYMKYYDKDKNFITPTVSAGNTITTPPNCYYFKFVMGSAYGTTYKNDTSINYPSTDTSYHAYNGLTTSIPFRDSSDNPITVYGGTLNVTSGELRVDKQIVDLGSVNWNYNSATATFNTIISGKTSGSNMACSAYKVVYKTAQNLLNGEISGLSVSGYVNVKNTDYTDATAFKTAMNGVQLVYELATPQTYQLTPAQVSTLLGQNNIFADCGQVLEGEYFVTL